MPALVVTNPTPFQRGRWVRFGSDGAPAVQVLCRKMPRGQIEAAYLDVPPAAQGLMHFLDDFRPAEPFLSKPVEAGLSAGFQPTITVGTHSRPFKLHDQTWVAQVPGSDEPAITKYEWRAQGPGFFARLWTTLGRGDVVMPFELWIGFEDKTKTRDTRYVAFEVEGLGVAHRIWTRDPGSKILYSGKITDRQSMDFQGSFLFYAGATTAQLETLKAEWTGPLVAYAPRDTAGVWKKPIPTISQEAWRIRHADKIEAMKRIMENPMAYVGFIGSLRPADTGAQGGFGSWQGIFTHAARWGETYRQSEDAWLDGLIARQECRRPIFFLEDNGELVRASRHPDLVTWAQGPHFNRVVSPDQLGRENQDWYLLQGEWIPNDEEHDVSALWPAHDVRINDSEVSRLTLEMAAQHLIARHTMPSTKPKWSTNGFGAGRAVGRTLLNVAETYLATGNLELLQHMERKWLEVIEPMFQDPLPEVPVYRVIEKDDRVFKGKKPGWVVWEDAIFVMGSDAFATVLRDAGFKTTAAKVQRITDLITRSIVEYGFMPDVKNPMILKLVSWELGGKAIPAEWYKEPKKEFIEDSSNTDFTTWARPALCIAARWTEINDPKFAAGTRARNLLENLRGSMDLYRATKYAAVI